MKRLKIAALLMALAAPTAAGATTLQCEFPFISFKTGKIFATDRFVIEIPDSGDHSRVTFLDAFGQGSSPYVMPNAGNIMRSAVAYNITLDAKGSIYIDRTTGKAKLTGVDMTETGSSSISGTCSPVTTEPKM